MVRFSLKVLLSQGSPASEAANHAFADCAPTFDDVLGYLASAMRTEEILRDFHFSTEQELRACLVFATDRERKLEMLNA